MFRENCNRYLIKTPTGYENFAGVQKKIVSDLYTFTFTDGKHIKCSGRHRFLTNLGFLKAEQITLEISISGKVIQKIDKEVGKFEVYDPVGVENHSTYISNDVVSHNTEFVGSSSTLISGPKIAQMMANIENPIAIEENLDIFEKPDNKKTYVISVDVSEGQELDYSAFSVIDVSKIPYTMVAKYRNNKIKPLLYPTVIYTTAKKYNDAFVLIEINSIGAQVADILHNELQYENLLKIRPSKGKVGQQLTAGYTKQMQFGLKQSVQTKKIGCANLKTLIESDKLIIKDTETVSEFTTFTVNKQSFKAEEGKTDDLVMSLVNFGWLSAQRHFKENVGNDIRKILQAEQFDIMDQDLVPFGIIDDGLNNTMENIDGDLWMEDRQKRYPFDDLNIDWRHKL